MTGNHSVQIIDLDTGITNTISWDSMIPDEAFESIFELKVKEAFGITDEAWVDVKDLNDSKIVAINKESLVAVTTPLVLVLSLKSDCLAPMKHSEIFEVIFHERSLGITINERRDSVRVNQFKSKADGTMGPAEASKKINIGDIVYKVNGSRTLGRPYDTVVQLLQTPVRPLRIQFFRPILRQGLYAVEFIQSSLNMTITTDDHYVLVSRLPQSGDNQIGYAESLGVCVGDCIHAIDGEMLNGPEYGRAVSLLKRAKRPLVVIFVRMSKSSSASICTPTNSERMSLALSCAPSPRVYNTANFSPAASPRYLTQSPRCSIGPSPRYSVYQKHNTSYENTMSESYLSNEAMCVEDMLDYCNSLEGLEFLTSAEIEFLKQKVLLMRPDLCSAIRHRNKNAIIAITRSPSMRLWNHLLKSRESIVLAGPVQLKRSKRYHMVLTDHERLLLVSKEKNALEDEILCSQIVTVSSRSKFHELIIATAKQEYVFIENFISPSIWVRAILPFTCTQGYLKVTSSKTFLGGTKKRYFILRGLNLTGYKKESHVHAQEAKSTTIPLHDLSVKIIDAKSFTFEIITPEISRLGKKLILSAITGREFNNWITSLESISVNEKQKSNPTHSSIAGTN